MTAAQDPGASSDTLILLGGWLSISGLVSFPGNHTDSGIRLCVHLLFQKKLLTVPCSYCTVLLVISFNAVGRNLFHMRFNSMGQKLRLSFQ